MRDERDANMVSQFSMGFPRIFYTADKPCGGNYVNNTDLFSCHGDKLDILYSKALVRDWRPSFPIRMKFPEPTECFSVPLMYGISLDVDAIQYRRRSIPNLLLDVSHIKRLFR
ncbi:hypothetical protein ACC817_12420 [Rhizobium ruizarguesonis]|uniref:hypothetical protein n=1 Tax=Rhizobium ruizarguesonis TaxID=2081791 RepID=UPI001031ADDC|nr:hypothetical protein [Rhizobium ruizarguesonis]TAY75083.1 hypothetical protein ELH84_15030 [Rhizobium ruizarguesonis]